MKIAIVVHTLKIGGMERVAVNLANAFDDAGHTAHLIYLKDKKTELTPKNKSLPIHLFNLKKSVFQTGIGVVWFALCKLLNAIFRQTFPLWFAYAGAIAFKKQLSSLEDKNGKFDLVIFRGQGTFEHVHPIHDERFVYVCESVQKKQSYGKLSKWVFDKLFQNRNVVCVSDGALNSFNDMTATYSLTPKKAMVLNNPNDFQQISAEANLITKPLHNKSYILGLGRLIPSKNFSLLVEAYQHAIVKYNLKQDLIIVGSGKDRGVIEKVVTKYGLQNRVHFKGQQTNPFPWYQQADLFVLSSKYEGLGMVLVEALACGTKVVSTDSKGGVRQVMNGDLELFLAQETSESLAEKINFALNREWDDSFSQAVESTLKKFDAQSVVNDYITAFK